ncbi:MAG: hypothetical protein LBF33_03210 [Oscillospiraceae bacterium]|jgi:hypothetical protein|nr:hypothetical protein [Oscillospiraceae bacterium]
MRQKVAEHLKVKPENVRLMFMAKALNDKFICDRLSFDEENNRITVFVKGNVEVLIFSARSVRK